MTIAGAMKQTPAINSPGQPPRSLPMWMAISVELGPGMRLGGADEIEELGVGEPAALGHDLVFHQRDMRDRASERGASEAQEERGQFAHVTGGGFVSCVAWHGRAALGQKTVAVLAALWRQAEDAPGDGRRNAGSKGVADDGAPFVPGDFAASGADILDQFERGIVIANEAVDRARLCHEFPDRRETFGEFLLTLDRRELADAVGQFPYAFDNRRGPPDIEVDALSIGIVLNELAVGFEAWLDGSGEHIHGVVGADGTE